MFQKNTTFLNKIINIKNKNIINNLSSIIFVKIYFYIVFLKHNIYNEICLLTTISVLWKRRKQHQLKNRQNS